MNAAGRSFLWATHYCAAQATYPEVVAHRAGTRPAEAELPPYLVLLRVGLALPAALLRRRCALTAPFHPYPGLAAQAVCFLWHFPSIGFPPCAKDAQAWATPSRTLSGTLLCGVRTFLSSCDERPSGPAANLFIIVQATVEADGADKACPQTLPAMARLVYDARSKVATRLRRAARLIAIRDEG